MRPAATFVATVALLFVFVLLTLAVWTSAASASAKWGVEALLVALCAAGMVVVVQLEQFDEDDE